MNPLARAEQAVLGAVFLDPGQLERLSPWLRPEHFYRPAHQALYASALALRDRGHPGSTAAVGAVPVSWVADAVTEAGTRTRGLTASYAHQLVTACPRPEHAVVYGRMVLEGAIHRTVAEHAVRLHQAARADTVRGGTEETLIRADALTTVLADLARRWGTEPRPIAPPVQPEPTPWTTAGVDADEEFLLACLTARPAQLDAVVGWLRPSDFGDPGHQQLYRALGALHHRGEPVDQLTVLWEVQRRGALTSGALDAERVLAVCDPLAVAGSAEHFGEQVLGAALVRTAAESARQIRGLAENAALPAGRLIGHALHALGPLDEVRRRWHTARTGPVPDKPRPPAAARSSPGRAEAARARSRPRRTNTPAPVAAPVPASPTRTSRRSPA
ncbi:DnaB-like helicase N-terminal domain-containing protein [Streptomyces qinzhouensis]|uniref:Helicase DnaB n=1 Tax=Streptomyces qinzhouensis TaxID=2599401 RepID=A0A5B8JCN7_9ACTN|nr:DnaB-like helicase N-terminal domain-containing protein [Streptomyces qinzhouensis]QDY78184.1 helicase DnaB [Streptomyces qinzhouensis]